MSDPLDLVAAELIAERFRALGDPTRMMILDHLGRHGDAAVSELAAQLGASQQNTSKHLAVLRLARIVSRCKQGTSSFYRIADPAVLTWIGAWDG